MRLLVVCTANICRSPMAEALLAHDATERGAEVVVESAGVRGWDDAPASEGSVDALARRGLDLRGHRSRPTDDAMVDAADLVLTMEVAHLMDLVSGRPDRFARSFTMRELAQRIDALAPSPPPRPADAGWSEWLAVVGEGRSARDLLGARDLDVADPIGRPAAQYRRCADQLASLSTTIADALWGPPGTSL